MTTITLQNYPYSPKQYGSWFDNGGYMKLSWQHNNIKKNTHTQKNNMAGGFAHGWYYNGGQIEFNIWNCHDNNITNTHQNNMAGGYVHVVTNWLFTPGSRQNKNFSFTTRVNSLVIPRPLFNMHKFVTTFLCHIFVIVILKPYLLNFTQFSGIPVINSLLQRLSI